ncbi:MAG TPA: cytochrome P460 family protein [Candidatus Eisenbacteria bacterium]|nr:cytochrome P460 family protein [Candidatus Eisenbacteria bacterium]
MKKNLLVAVLFVLATVASAQEADVDFPKDYRRWQHVKSMVIQKGHPLFDAFGGIHHIYANARAVQGYQKGKFPDGSVIVFDLLEAVPENNAITEGKRKVLGVMQKDAKRFSKTGGWGFEGFAGGDPKNRVVKDAVKACFECHSSQKDKDYVFSSWRN